MLSTNFVDVFLDCLGRQAATSYLIRDKENTLSEAKHSGMGNQESNALHQYFDVHWYDGEYEGAAASLTLREVTTSQAHRLLLHRQTPCDDERWRAPGRIALHGFPFLRISRFSRE